MSCFPRTGTGTIASTIPRSPYVDSQVDDPHENAGGGDEVFLVGLVYLENVFWTLTEKVRRYFAQMKSLF